MSKTYKDKPEQYRSNKDYPKYKPKEKRFESTKGRSKDALRKEIYYESKDYP